ncbi:hypothetical protein ACHWQZ_G006233 [Mnemiopsis leidyi]
MSLLRRLAIDNRITTLLTPCCQIHSSLPVFAKKKYDGKLHKSQMKRERRILQLMRYQQKLITQSAAMLGDPQAPTEEDSIILSNTQEVKSKRKAGM